MLIRFGDQVRLTGPLALRLERITGVRPCIRSVEDLEMYFRHQLDRFGNGDDRHKAIKLVLLAEMARALGCLPRSGGAGAIERLAS